MKASPPQGILSAMEVRARLYAPPGRREGMGDVCKRIRVNEWKESKK
jgi:hypothetical protein